jgi:hypothetical protein
MDPMQLFKVQAVVVTEASKELHLVPRANALDDDTEIELLGLVINASVGLIQPELVIEDAQKRTILVDIAHDYFLASARRFSASA